MLGCIGVAPARKEAISTAAPGAFGGNMDYASMGAGVKLMLPVNEPGALLFLGDGHARQGEGEVAGTGLETSMDVEFSVELVKKKAIGWPRLETETHVMVLGSARPLLEAFQHATTELQRWLMADYGLTERGAQTFMGQATEYEIANVVDPNFTVVAKIREGDAAAALMLVRDVIRSTAAPTAGPPSRWWSSASTARRSSTSIARSPPASRRTCARSSARSSSGSSSRRSRASPTRTTCRS